MIKQYKQLQVLDSDNENCFIYKVQKDSKKYFMYEYENGKITEAQTYNFKMLQKVACNHFSHMLCIVESFQIQGNKYYIVQYAQDDLLKLQYNHPNSVFPLVKGLEIISKVFENIEELHSQRYVYRNIRSESIKMKDNEPYFFDFTFSQFMKRKQRMFDLVGCSFYLAPQFFIEDGYGKQIDIWAAGVLLFFMITKEYPFKIQNAGQGLQALIKTQLEKKCSGGFKFKKILSETNNPGSIKSNKYLQDFFSRIFEMDYSKRITISQIKKHPLFDGFYPNQIPSNMLQQITQSGNSSIFISKFNNFSSSYQFHKEQIIIDFIERSSQAIDIDCADKIAEQLRNKIKFAILKVGMIKLKNLLDIIYGIKKPQFKINEEEWNKVRSSSGFVYVKQKIQKTKKIVEVYYKSSFMILNITQPNQFFTLNIPQSFNDIKIQYRSLLSLLFEGVKKQLIINKENRKIARKLTETLVRITILHLVNRIFEDEGIEDNFDIYFQWSKANTKSLDNLDGWILDQKVNNLKAFMKKITYKYL